MWMASKGNPYIVLDDAEEMWSEFRTMSQVWKSFLSV